MLKKILLITVLVTLFPVLLKVGYYVFVFFLFLSILLIVLFFLIRKKVLRNLQQMQFPNVHEANIDPDEQNIVIDVKAERRS